MVDPQRVLKYAVYAVASDDRYNSLVLIVSSPNTNIALIKSEYMKNKPRMKVLSEQATSSEALEPVLTLNNDV